MPPAIDHNLMHPEDACSGETESAALAVHEAALDLLPELVGPR
jgi:hypothetical protein